jgi:hypothetical protein
VTGIVNPTFNKFWKDLRGFALQKIYEKLRVDHTKIGMPLAATRGLNGQKASYPAEFKEEKSGEVHRRERCTTMGRVALCAIGSIADPIWPLGASVTMASLAPGK